jgi:hypothetical protein
MPQAHDHDTWTVEQVGTDETVTIKLRNGEPHRMRLTYDGEAVEVRVDDDAVGKVLNRQSVPAWVRNVADRLGLTRCSKRMPDAVFPFPG